MSDDKDQGESKGRLSLRPGGRSELGRTVDAGSVRQSFSHGRSKVVQVEVRKKRGLAGNPPAPETGTVSRPQQPRSVPGAPAPRGLTAAEQAARQRAVAEQQREAAREAARREAEQREQEKISILSAAEEARRREEEDAKRALEESVRKADEERAQREAAEHEAAAAAAADTAKPEPVAAPQSAPVVPRRPEPVAQPRKPTSPTAPAAETLRLKPARPGGRDEEDDGARGAPRRPGIMSPARKAPVPPPKKLGGDDRRRGGARIDVQAAVEGDDERVRSLASVRRQRDRERRQAELEMLRSDQVRVVREVILPDTITVQELANRMAARVSDLIKALMKLGVMATVTQSIDADTAELVINEFGHKARRVSEADVESGLEGETDAPETLVTRPPVVTVMGHVDHGKTSLLDALRHADVAAREAGGITQHIGAYQVTLENGGKITFIDTPGHEAFTAMRARGAGVTDIVVLVVAADDGVMPQTVEAIRHAKAANAPIIVAINKMDKADANPDRVRNELLQYDVVVEAMGGENQDVEVSATKRMGLDNLLEAILLQAEILDLRANPDRAAEGAVIESRLDRGRGPVATMLVQKGSLHQGDIVVAGAEWGRVRAMLDDRGKAITEAAPSTPVEILGLSAAPSAGEAFVVVENEGRAREVAEFRQRRERERSSAATGAGRGTLDQMIARIQAGEQKEVAVVIKADVQGSSEAIQATVEKLGNDEVRVRALIASVGQITESDVQLAKASNAIVIGFNVRATSQARDLARRDDVDIRYYSIIYEVADDIEKIVRGKLAPVHREKFLGYAEIRQVFNITKVGKVAGCYITEGVVRRGAGVRLLRDGVVIHQGQLSQLKRFKDDVREVARGYECGLSFAGFNDLKEGDVVECYETEIVPA
ncbi:MAG TPA: translation initiation factor IF-2 [Acetobacteraceae bacterium]|nr:translation initiation factor IF-2 [Acetobacteraceae bacterium]